MQTSPIMILDTTRTLCLLDVVMTQPTGISHILALLKV